MLARLAAIAVLTLVVVVAPRGVAGSPPRGRSRAAITHSLSDRVLRRVLRDRRSDVHTCAALVARRGEPVPPRIDLELLIAPGGRVQEASVSSRGGGGALGRCVTARARTWSFPRARSHSRTRVPFVLQ